MCIALYHALKIYIHSTSLEMSRVCKHLGVHKHYMSNGTCRESLDMAYQCIANEVIKILLQKTLQTNNTLQTIYLYLYQMVKYSIWQFCPWRSSWMNSILLRLQIVITLYGAPNILFIME